VATRRVNAGLGKALIDYTLLSRSMPATRSWRPRSAGAPSSSGHDSRSSTGWEWPLR